jgi:hypothetical protein
MVNVLMKVTIHFKCYFRVVQGQPFFTLELLLSYIVIDVNFVGLMVLLCGSNLRIIELIPLCIL